MKKLSFLSLTLILLIVSSCTSCSSDDIQAREQLVCDCDITTTTYENESTSSSVVEETTETIENDDCDKDGQIISTIDEFGQAVVTEWSCE